MMRLKLSAGSCLLLLSLACGGGGGGGTAPAPAPPPATPTWATALAYTDPTSGFRLVRNASLSTTTRLVLDLVGPAGQSGRGVAFILKTDASKVTWAQPPGFSGLVQPVTLDPGTGTQALVGLDKGNGTLHGGVFQKAGSFPLDQPLARVCLALKPNTVSANSPVSLTFISGNSLSDAGVAPITITLGALTAQ